MADPALAIPRAREPKLWLLGVTADGCPAEERAAIAERWSPLAERPDRLLLVTCHRVELYGAGPHSEALAAVGEAAEAWPDAARSIGRRRGRAVVRHVLRLGAGLESSVVGEDQVLHQVRDLLELARGRAADARLLRLLEAAIGVGRRARAAREGRAGTLAGQALEWLAERMGETAVPSLTGRRVLVVGSGAMGRLLALESKAAGAHVAVASRTLGHAEDVARLVGGHPLDLASAAFMLPQVDGAAIALGGPWNEVAALGGPSIEVAGDSGLGLSAARRGRSLPPIVDLSSPAALPGAVRAALDGRFAGIDDLFRRHGIGSEDEAYARAAEWLVDEAADAYVRWSAGRESVRTLRQLRGVAESRRILALERLYRRLPGLTPRERALVEEFSQQLVAGILHSPTVALRDDVDGAADDAARALFALAAEADDGEAPDRGRMGPVPTGGDEGDEREEWASLPALHVLEPNEASR